MKAPEKYDENDMPWDVKTVKIELGDHGDEWLEVEVFGDKQFRITFKNADVRGCDGEQTVEEMHMDVARRLRDFLNYAVPNVEVTGAARLHRTASVWTAGLGVVAASLPICAVCA